MTGVRESFDLTGRVAVVTGGAGLLGRRHAEAISELGGIPVILDLEAAVAEQAALEVPNATWVKADVTDEGSIEAALAQILREHGRVDILINNAANNPAVDASAGSSWSRLESFPVAVWDRDLAVGLTGAFLCSRIVGAELARRGKGAIVNVCSDLALISPDQRIYRVDGLPDDEQPVKPVSYSAVKAGLLGLTRYLATYWAEQGVRVNALSPGGVTADQDAAFVAKLSNLIPLGRMADDREYKAAVAFLISDASSYMTGANLVVDGGRTCW